MFGYSKVCFLLLYVVIAPVLCNYDIHKIYDEYVTEVLNMTGIKHTILSFAKDDAEDNMWLWQMIDASSKVPNGILAGDMFDMGNFDECYDIKHEDIYGKYCLGSLALNPNTEKYYQAFAINTTQIRPRLTLHVDPRTGILPEYIQIRFSVCVPHTLAASEIPGVVDYTEDYCYSKATVPELSTGAIVTIALLSFFGLVIACSTAFDIYLYYNNKKPPHELTIAFSFLSNGRKLFQSTTNPDQLLCLNGIKAISMMWVIQGHLYSNAWGAPLSNFNYVWEWQNEAANYFINNAGVSVDSFFVCGGLVSVYVFLKSMDKGAKFNIVLFYVHRYLRLTPAFVIMSLIHLYIINYLSYGPLWKNVDDTLVKPCEKAWWSSFLYITNYVRNGNCLPQTWYLSVDMQLFVVSPLILIPLTKWKKPTLCVLYFLALLGCVTPFIVGYWYLGPGTNSFDTYYIQTHTRFGPYVIGMILGYYIYNIKKSKITIKLNLVEATVAWLICLTGLTACLYSGAAVDENDKVQNSIYLAFDRNGWAVFLCGAIFLCVSGNGGPIDTFLSLPIFQFLAKVSYSMYLVHFFIIVIRYAALKTKMKFSNLGMMHAFWGDFMFTLGVSVVLCLAFESPVIILEKYLFGKGAPPKPQSAKNQEKNAKV